MIRNFFAVLNKADYFLNPLFCSRFAGDLNALLVLTFFTLILPFILFAFGFVIEADELMFLILLSAVVIWVFNLSATIHENKKMLKSIRKTCCSSKEKR